MAEYRPRCFYGGHCPLKKPCRKCGDWKERKPMVKIAPKANTMQNQGKVRLGGESPSFGPMIGDEKDKDGLPNDNGGLAGKLPRK